LEGLFLKANSQAVLAQLGGAEVQFEDPKTEPALSLLVFSHPEGDLDRN
jgi:hypothetical protein